MMKTPIITAFCLFLFGGCTTTEQLSTPPQKSRTGECTLYLIWPKFHAGTAVAYSVFLDGEKVGKVKNNSYTVIYTTPGEYEIKGKPPLLSDMLKPATGNFTLNEGEEYYLSLSWTTKTSRFQVPISIGAGATIYTPMTSEDMAEAEWQVLPKDIGHDLIKDMRFTPSSKRKNN